MAYITETTGTFGASINAFAANITSTVANFFSDLTKAASRAQAIEELQAMDNKTLKAKHGITRSQIVSYIFQDKILP